MDKRSYDLNQLADKRLTEDEIKKAAKLIEAIIDIMEDKDAENEFKEFIKEMVRRAENTAYNANAIAAILSKDGE